MKKKAVRIEVTNVTRLKPALASVGVVPNEAALSSGLLK